MALCSGGYDSSCLHMDCTHVNDASCQAKCKFPDNILARCPLAPAGPAQIANTIGQAFQQLVSPPASAGGPGGAPDTSVDADCDPWGPLKFLCVAGKSLTKGGQALAGPCGPIPIPCAWLGIAGVVIVAFMFLVLLKGR